MDLDEANAGGGAWWIERGEGPLVAAAIHNGHGLRPEVERLVALDEPARLREEDPFTEGWTTIAPTRIVGLRSRFEVDLNRPPERCVYLDPADAWGLDVWRQRPPEAVVARSRSIYDRFYEEVRRVLGELVSRHGRVVVLDLHSYNHRRAGPGAAAAPPAENPDLNLGTGSLDRERWKAVVDALVAAVSGFDYRGRRLDVRENVRFRGGCFSQWIHRTFPRQVCCLAIEVKKIFMDEWTGRPYAGELETMRDVLGAAAAAVADVL